MKQFTMSMYSSKKDLYKDKSVYWEGMFDTLLEMSAEQVLGRKLANDRERENCLEIVEAMMEEHVYEEENGDTQQGMLALLKHLPAIYAPELCDEGDVKEAKKYFSARGGVLWVCSKLKVELEGRWRPPYNF